MSTGAIDHEMRQRFAAAEKVRVAQTALARPALQPDEGSLRRHFEGVVGRAEAPLENPHLEERVTRAQRDEATPASVLLAIVLREPEPTILVTQRSPGISYPGHWVFPGGRADPGDVTPVATALREAEEEIGLGSEHVEIIGRLGDYVSHSGFRIAPSVALVRPPFDLAPHPGEVEAIAELPLRQLVSPASYILYRFEGRRDRAHFALHIDERDIMLTGVTVSVCIGLYSELLKTHT